MSQLIGFIVFKKDRFSTNLAPNQKDLIKQSLLPN